MIALNETVEAAAEIPFYLPLISDPLTGLTGHSFVLGEVQIRLPFGAWQDATLAKIVEIGYGRYVVRLVAAQCLAAGVVYIRANVDTAQPYFGSESIDVLGGDIAVGVDGYIPFYLPNEADPVFGPPITGYTFTTGEVRIRLPGGVYADADVADIAEVGFGSYALLLEAGEGDTINRGKAFIYATAVGAQRFEGFVTILGSGVTTVSVVTLPAGVTLPVIPNNPVSVSDHVSAALGRLPMQFRS